MKTAAAYIACAWHVAHLASAFTGTPVLLTRQLQHRPCHMVSCSVSDEHGKQHWSTTIARHISKHARTGLACLSAAALIAGGTPDAAIAADKRLVGEIPASGFFFKDTLNVEAFADPKVQGVTLYISDFSRPLAEKIGKMTFSDPSTASMTCIADGPVVLSNDINFSRSGEEVFEEKRSLFFKSIKVRRIIDKDSGNIIYVSYTDKFDPNSDDTKSRFKSSLCAVRMQ
eukprot:TRINITY_DN11862_c0_g1_i1.p1 TRINITY_DN11862_c0_g1~~TRINITY_DN11862_c0_g1_i1.p1  ORF type:complete len:228 (+),score=59.41 TRINITY_DN11862_c0_g1_i1:98-781(+)